ncbi:MAG: heparinase II/III family protein [Opitutaceae bacterium]|nr:heparinase II/III family protein [Opitutaceae bacterium]
MPVFPAGPAQCAAFLSRFRTPLLCSALIAGPGVLCPGRLAATELKPPAPLAYDTSAYELAASIPGDPAPWNRNEVERAVRERTVRQKQRHELDVYYYRIGHTLAFPLPLARRPARTELPAGIATMAYPWMIWLSWELEERWRILHFAWRENRDRDAGARLQRELAALATWDRIIENNNQPGLVTAHIAGCLALALSRTDGWDPALLEQARAAADALIERDVWPWFLKQWAEDRPYDHRRLVNIPVITLARAAQLARVVGSPRREALDRRMTEVLRTWARFRTGPEFHTEGTTYDGYLMDSVTGWLTDQPERAGLLRECRTAFRSLVDQWIHLTLPGRMDLHAPMGDVEPEMPFWTCVVARLGGWYSWSEATWLLTRVPIERLPAATLADVLHAKSLLGLAPDAPAAGPHEHPHAVSLRTGWAARDAAAFVSVVRNPMTHLQADGGQVILGWQSRFWITDPGYQQYRAGEEREYSIGPQAHNAPVINGNVQKPHAAKLDMVEIDAAGAQYSRLNLSACYPGLPKSAHVQREVWLARNESTAIVVRDTFGSLPADAEIGTHWLGGNHLAWAFVDGWARLSDGKRAVWVGTFGDRIEAAALIRHPGSRGPLTLAHKARLADGAGRRWWVLWCDESGGWTPPQLSADFQELTVRPPQQSGTPMRFRR